MTLATVTGLSAWILVAAFIGLCLWAGGSCWWIVSGHKGAEERVRPEREQPIDLAAERRAYVAARDRREEANALRRAA